MKYSEDIDFMSNLSAAMLERNSRSTRIMVNAIFICVIWLLVWASFATLDEITRGMGKIVPSSQVQVVQNLEGGILAEILVKIGDTVEIDQPLLKIANKKFESNFEESMVKLDEYKIRAARLTAESSGSEFKVTPDLEKSRPDLIKNERSLLETNLGFLNNQIAMINQQIVQKKNEIKEANTVLKNSEVNRELLAQQISMTRPLTERGVSPKTDMIRLEREMAGIQERLEVTRATLPRHESSVKELENKVEETKMSFRSRAQKELGDMIAQISQIEESQSSLKDQVTRTLLKSPVKGIVKQIHLNTVGGVVKPGMDLIEVVPLDDKLLVEVQVRPSDIAFIHPGQPAKVKITAYDYSIYGGLDGKVVHISADTMTDNRSQSYYLVKIETDKNYLGKSDKPKKIMPGMTATVDILTGKKTVMDYLLKPILKVKHEALTER
ncbi:MAG TPA: HlyD family type I secretion periplasmic adaptor subunit [Candidatus Wallbacteria bacterium]|nr:HlyD family type I secretion periplasmic adaptor subunit [Candidatus Wallbacteria bacterium]